MTPLSREDFELECDLARWEEAISEAAEREYDDRYQAALSEAEALELAAGSKMRPFSEEV